MGYEWELTQEDVNEAIEKAFSQSEDVDRNQALINARDYYDGFADMWRLYGDKIERYRTDVHWKGSGKQKKMAQPESLTDLFLQYFLQDPSRESVSSSELKVIKELPYQELLQTIPETQKFFENFAKFSESTVEQLQKALGEMIRELSELSGGLSKEIPIYEDASEASPEKPPKKSTSGKRKRQGRAAPVQLPSVEEVEQMQQVDGHSEEGESPADAMDVDAHSEDEPEGEVESERPLCLFFRQGGACEGFLDEISPERAEEFIQCFEELALLLPEVHWPRHQAPNISLPESIRGNLYKCFFCSAHGGKAKRVDLSRAIELYNDLCEKFDKEANPLILQMFRGEKKQARKLHGQLLEEMGLDEPERKRRKRQKDQQQPADEQEPSGEEEDDGQRESEEEGQDSSGEEDEDDGQRESLSEEEEQERSEDEEDSVYDELNTEESIKEFRNLEKEHYWSRALTTCFNKDVPLPIENQEPILLDGQTVAFSIFQYVPESNGVSLRIGVHQGDDDDELQIWMQVDLPSTKKATLDESSLKQLGEELDSVKTLLSMMKDKVMNALE